VWHMPQVFNDSNTFSEWFTRFLGVDTFGDNGGAAGDNGRGGGGLGQREEDLAW